MTQSCDSGKWNETEVVLASQQRRSVLRKATWMLGIARVGRPFVKLKELFYPPQQSCNFSEAAVLPSFEIRDHLSPRKQLYLHVT